MVNGWECWSTHQPLWPLISDSLWSTNMNHAKPWWSMTLKCLVHCAPESCDRKTGGRHKPQQWHEKNSLSIHRDSSMVNIIFNELSKCVIIMTEFNQHIFPKLYTSINYHSILFHSIMIYPKNCNSPATSQQHSAAVGGPPWHLNSPKVLLCNCSRTSARRRAGCPPAPKNDPAYSWDYNY